MLAVQTYLAGGKTLADLGAEFAIRAQRHDTLPLVILNYDQIDSPKTHPVVRECRGLVLHGETFALVARGFSRFFNWGEVREEMGLFDFGDFVVHTKEDGSLVLLYHFGGRWMANTRGSFAQYPMEHQDFTWEEAFCKALRVARLDDLAGTLDPSVCYVCEFCSPYNKVVRRYPEPVLFLLTAFRGETELSCQEVDHLAGPFLRPTRHAFGSVEEIQEFLQAQAETDPTFEGVVLCDGAGRRWKVKSPTYLGLHRLKGEGNNLFHPHHLLPFVLAGEDAELLTYFPEVTEAYRKVKEKVHAAYDHLEAVWRASWQIEGQKEFALAVVGKTPFTGILFSLRKERGKDQTVALLKKAWRNSADGIAKVLFK